LITPDKDHCFIITPIGDDTDPIRRHIEGIIDAAITPALGDNYEIVVAHKISEPGSITKQIIAEVYNAKLVIANITNRNPNVMYELALRHAIGKPAIMIAEKGTSLPSDIIMQRTIFYYNDAKGVLELKEDLKKAEQNISFSDKCGPIYDILGDISHDTNLLKSVKETDTQNIQPMEYILNRLNRIEDAILHLRHFEPRTFIPDEHDISLFEDLSDTNISPIFKKNDLVMHKIFGPGRVDDISKFGKDFMLTISFDSSGTKRVMYSAVLRKNLLTKINK